MKKRILTLLLAALLIATVTACNDRSDPSQETESSHVTEDSGTEHEASSDSLTEEADVPEATGSIPCNGVFQNSAVTYDVPQDGAPTVHIDAWEESHTVTSLSDIAELTLRKSPKAIAVNDERAFFVLLHYTQPTVKTITVVCFEKGSQSKTVTSFEVDESVYRVSGNFINESTGYLFVFQEVSDGHAAGGSKLSSLLRTEDGGCTWNPVSVENAVSISLRESVEFAKMASENIGLISGHFFGYDYNFCERTLLTTDGGANWVNVADLPQINELQWAVVTDFSSVDGSYILTVRYTVSGTDDHYATYRLTDLNTWIRVDE